MSFTEKKLRSTLEQDRAAGSIENRKVIIRSGDVVTISLIVGEKRPAVSLCDSKVG